jgi:hypothetical protein
LNLGSNGNINEASSRTHKVRRLLQRIAFILGVLYLCEV